MAFNIGLAGLRASSTDLDVTGNNVANASTVGFKRSRAEFADVYVSQLLGTGSKPIGSGAIVDNVRQLFTQGNITQTDNALDLAIDGGGFFVLNDNEVQTYTRAGYFGLDKEGFVVTNSGARLQGFEANEQGVATGILDDIRVIVSDQPPSATTRFSSIVNVDAGASILQEQGLQVSTEGFAIATAVSGIAESTSSILSSSGQPTTVNRATVTLGGLDPAVPIPAGSNLFDIDPDGVSGFTNVITTNAIAANAADPEAYVNAVITELQAEMNNLFGANEFNIDAEWDAGNAQYNIIVQRDGYSAISSSDFILGGGVDFGLIQNGVATNTPVGSTAGSRYFIGSSPIDADFRSINGTQASLRSDSTPSLNITNFVAGSPAVITAAGSPGAYDFSPGNQLQFQISVGGTAAQTVTVDATDPNLAAAPGQSLANLILAIDNQISGLLPPATNVNVVANGTDIEFQGTVNGEAVIISDVAASPFFDLASIGFTSTNRADSGVADVQANNQFELTYNQDDEFGAPQSLGPYLISIPPANYATLNDLTDSIQTQINNYIGSTGIADKIEATTENGLLVFKSKLDGADKSISFNAVAGAPNAPTDLGMSSPFFSQGTDSVDRSNSFRINLTVPAPDEEGRSGFATITLDEEYRSVQQIAQSINRQLATQTTGTGGEFIGVRAEAVEVTPKVNPPQYELQLRATEEGEASVITISDFVATGQDITTADMLGLLNIDPTDSTLLTAGVRGVDNRYPEQEVTLTDPDGVENVISIPEFTPANEIASLLNRQAGVTASATTEVYVPLSGYNNSANAMNIVVNGQTITANNFPAMVEEINDYQSTTLPGIQAELSEDGDLFIRSIIGQDIKLTIDSPNVGDSLVVRGQPNTGFVTLGGTASADRSVAVGGIVDITLNQGYSLSNPDPSLSGIFGTLSEDEFTTVALNTFDPDDQNTYNHATSTTVYDSLGNPHIMTQYFVKEPLDPTRPTENNIWAMYVLIDGQDVGDPDPDLPFPQNVEPTRARFELFFNPDGSLDEDVTPDIFITNWDPKDEDGNPTGALTSRNVLEGGLPLEDPPNSSNFQVELLGSTQFGSGFTVNEVSQDGYAAGRLIGLEVDRDGILFARYTNGQARTISQIALANFKNPEGLTPLGDTQWAESFESGTPAVGSPRTGSFGAVRGSSLEESNVDLSEELVGLIIAQRNFQANAKTIETSDAVTQTIINI